MNPYDISPQNKIKMGGFLLPKPYRVITWNVNSVKVREERLLGVLGRHQPDALCLQELKTIDEQFPLEKIKNMGYHASIYGQKAYNGVAVLSKKEPLGITKGFGFLEDPSARYIEVEFNNKIFVSSVYAPNGQDLTSDKYKYKLAWYKNFTNYLRAKMNPHHKIILGGDYNVAPHLHDTTLPADDQERILCSTGEREAFTELLGVGLVDSLHLLNPKDQIFTWWDYRMGSFQRNKGMRIDHILVSSNLTECLESFHVDRDERKGDRPSDHAPVILDFSV